MDQEEEREIANQSNSYHTEEQVAAHSKLNRKRSEFRMGFDRNVTEIFKKWGKRTRALAILIFTDSELLKVNKMPSVPVERVNTTINTPPPGKMRISKKKNEAHLFGNDSLAARQVSSCKNKVNVNMASSVSGKVAPLEKDPILLI
ncbi:hypothetical protein HUJ04_010151 [Dendroctonus ponderosae]|nr:hypothetical protein HUJ04_010151 [Dendroctonus ponderosae]